MSARPTDITQAFLDYKPNIVHYAGHGLKTGELCFENDLNEMQPVEPDVLADLFELISDQTNCVLLNSCYSEIQAKAIVKHIPYVIGMNQSIGDKAAIAFATGFYKAIGGGFSVEKAFKFGCIEIRLNRIPDYQTPRLHIRKKSTILKEVPKVQWELKLKGTLTDDNKRKAEPIVDELCKILRDSSLKLKKMCTGSIRLILEGSQEEFEIFKELVESGRITEVLGFQIESVQSSELEVSTFQKSQDLNRAKYTNPSQNLVRLEDSIAETELVAIIRQEPEEISRLNKLEFCKSFDDLDYLVFATLSLPSGHKVALVRHENSPTSGTEICVKYNQPNTAAILQEALREMNLTSNDLTWIHPEYEQQLDNSTILGTVNLSNWLKNLVEEGWQTIEEVLGSRQEVLFSAARFFDKGVARATAINFGQEPTSISLALVVDIIAENPQNLNVCLRICSLGNQSFLPLGLKLAVLYDTGNLVKVLENQNQDRWLRFDINCVPGERFSVKITLDDENTTVDFVV